MRIFMVEDDVRVADAIRIGLSASEFAIDHINSAQTHNAIELYIPRLRAERDESVHIRMAFGHGYRLEETEK